MLPVCYIAALIAAQMEAALELCVIGYEPGTFLQPFQTICLPGWTPACAYVWQASRCPACPSIPTCKYYVVQPGEPRVAGWQALCCLL